VKLIMAQADAQSKCQGKVTVVRVVLYECRMFCVCVCVCVYVRACVCTCFAVLVAMKCLRMS